MKKLFLMTLCSLSFMITQAQENVTATFYRNADGTTVNCHVELVDRWPANYLITNNCWCTITAYEVPLGGSPVQLTQLAPTAHPASFFWTTQPVYGLDITFQLHSGESASEYYIHLSHYSPWTIPVDMRVQDTYSARVYAGGPYSLNNDRKPAPTACRLYKH